MTSNNRKGFTFVDIILILIMVTMMAAAGVGFYIALNKQHQIVIQQMTAINLATAQIEDLIALPYSDPLLAPGNGQAATVGLPLPTPAGPYALTYSVVVPPVYGGMNYKQITATATTPAPARVIPLTAYKAS